jgi:hypothetical protein
MTKIERLFPIFGIIFAAAYAYVLYHDMPLVTYHPMLGEWDIGRAASRKGPAMYWYGLVLTAFVVAVPLTALCALIPEKITDKISSSLVTWLVPLVAMFSFVWLLWPYFTKQ